MQISHNQNVKDVDYQPMFRAACVAAVITTGTKLAVTVIVARHYGAGMRLAFAWGWLPYIQFLTDQVTFARIASISTLAMALVAAATFAAVVMRGTAKQAVAGTWCAVLSIIETLIVEFVLNLINPPYLDFRWTRWTLLVLVAALAVTAAWLVLDRPWRDDDSFDSGTPLTLAGS